ncbi:hypothetical protein SAMN05443635_103261 [Roseobacter denitrificans OCh 114]|nr:hypothetical protein SAMN05443635_103261 [Roseobacter denitrificans OCh 114]
MYSYDEYTLLRLRLGRWDPESSPKPVHAQIKPLPCKKLLRRAKQIVGVRPSRIKS